MFVSLEYLLLSLPSCSQGVLLYGPPGTGKTLLARAIASNIEANFLKVVSSAIVDKYIGESARVIREMFGYARCDIACIVATGVTFCCVDHRGAPDLHCLLSHLRQRQWGQWGPSAQRFSRVAQLGSCRLICG